MKSVVAAVVVLAILGGGLFWFLGGHRVEVAKKKITDKIDDMLGKLDVQKAEIDAGIKAAKQGAEGIRRAKVKAQVQLEQLDEKVRPFEERITQCDQSLLKLRDLIQADTSAEIAGKNYSPTELKDMANQVIQERKKSEDQINGFKTARENLKKLVAKLAKSQEVYEARIANLQTQVTKLDAEMTAAKAMKQASTLMGDQDATMSTNLDQLEQKIATLTGDVRSTLTDESERWSETQTDKALNDVDAFIRNSQKKTDTLEEIDRILGKKK